MCNVSEAILEYGVQQGIQQGVQQGVEKTSLQMIQNLMESGGFSFDVAAKLLKIPESEQDNYRALIEQK